MNTIKSESADQNILLSGNETAASQDALRQIELDLQTLEFQQANINELAAQTDRHAKELQAGITALSHDFALTEEECIDAEHSAADTAKKV